MAAPKFKLTNPDTGKTVTTDDAASAIRLRSQGYTQPKGAKKIDTIITQAKESSGSSTS